MSRVPYSQADYDSLAERVEESVDLLGNENEEEYSQKVLSEFGGNIGIAVAMPKIYEHFDKSSLRKEFNEANSQAQELPEDFRKQFEKEVDEGTNPQEALRNAQISYENYREEQAYEVELQKQEQELIARQKELEEQEHKQAERIERQLARLEEIRIEMMEREVAYGKPKYMRYERYAYEQAYGEL